MREAGNATDPNRYGLILPESENEDGDTNWMVDLTFTDSGYIKDDDAKEWDVEAMLEQLKEGTEEQNKERASRNLPELETRGWVEKPQYDAKTIFAGSFSFGLIAQINGCRALDDLVINVVRDRV